MSAALRCVVCIVVDHTSGTEAVTVLGGLAVCALHIPYVPSDNLLTAVRGVAAEARGDDGTWGAAR